MEVIPIEKRIQLDGPPSDFMILTLILQILRKYKISSIEINNLKRLLKSTYLCTFRLLATHIINGKITVLAMK